MASVSNINKITFIGRRSRKGPMKRASDHFPVLEGSKLPVAELVVEETAVVMVVLGVLVILVILVEMVETKWSVD